MTRVGEIKKGRDIGKAGGTSNFIWHSCPDCGRERWVSCTAGKPDYSFCIKCVHKGDRFSEVLREALHRKSGANSPNWRGGVTNTTAGYRMATVFPDDFFYPMATKVGTVMEHRLVMARFLNRCLLPWEIVHHKNGIRNDNRLGNLELLPHKRYHLVDTVTKTFIFSLQKRIKTLEKLLEERRGE